MYIKTCKYLLLSIMFLVRYVWVGEFLVAQSGRHASAPFAGGPDPTSLRMKARPIDGRGRYSGAIRPIGRSPYGGLLARRGMIAPAVSPIAHLSGTIQANSIAGRARYKNEKTGPTIGRHQPVE